MENEARVPPRAARRQAARRAAPLRGGGDRGDVLMDDLKNNLASIYFNLILIKLVSNSFLLLLVRRLVTTSVALVTRWG